MIPNSRMGSVIGKQGSKIKEIQDASGARLNASEGMLPGSTEVCIIKDAPFALLPIFTSAFLSEFSVLRVSRMRSILQPIISATSLLRPRSGCRLAPTHHIGRRIGVPVAVMWAPLMCQAAPATRTRISKA